MVPEAAEGPHCSERGCTSVPPASHPRSGDLGRNGGEGGGCGTAAPKGNGPRKPSGRQTAAGVQLVSPQAGERPLFPLRPLSRRD